jgi:exosortase/archaeosortase family protein
MKYLLKLLIRLLTAAIFRSPFFSLIFGPLTILFSYLSLIPFGYNPIIDFSTNTIVINGHYLKFIPACTAAAAYYLLLLLIILTKDIEFKTRLKMMLFGSLLILAMNIIRIDILIIALVDFGKEWFNVIHMAFWRFISSIYVALVWIFLINKYKIKTIPIYSDIKYLYSISSLKKRKKPNRS